MLNVMYVYFQVFRRAINVTKRIIKRKIAVRHTAYGEPILNTEQGGELIKEFLSSDKPCMIARIGSVEMQAINAVLNIENGLRKSIPEANMCTLNNNAGFFPATEEAVTQFVDIYRDACNELDVAAMLLNRDEDYFYKRYTQKVRYITLTALEPYYSKQPWSAALKDKRVLVIHPFSQTIMSQYQKRESLFENKEVLPDFELQTVKAVQTIGDNKAGFENWFDALESMKKEIAVHEFDIAIIGCGAYAFPLAAYIKRMGKKAIILGGATQILFGISGKRWDNSPVISALYNEAWIRPNKEERPKGFERVEGGCYW